MPDIVLQPKQGQVFDLIENSQASWIGAPGGRGSAKSGGIDRWMLLRRTSLPGTIGAIVMRNYDQIKKYHIDVMLREYPELEQYWVSQDSKFKIPTGEEERDGIKVTIYSEINMMHADTLADVIRCFRSGNFYDIMVDQAEQFTEAELREMKQANRTKGAPMGACKFLLCFNMAGAGIDFLRKKFHLKEYNNIERPEDFQYVHFYPWDNVEWSKPALAEDGLTVKDYYSWTDAQREEYCARRSDYGRNLNSQDEVFRKRDWKASWDSLGGTFFGAVFDRDSCVINLETVAKLIKPWSKRWLSQDWGKGHYCVTQWHASVTLSPDEAAKILGWDLRLPINLVVTYREYIAGGAADYDEGADREMAEADIAREIVDRTPRDERPHLDSFFLSPDAFEMSVRRSGQVEIAKILGQELRRYGLPYPQKADAARKDGWSLMYNVLLATKRQGRPEQFFEDKDVIADTAWLISVNCPELIKAIPLLMRDPKNLDDVLKTDKEAAKLEQDCADCARYGLKSMLGAVQKPWAVHRQEEIIKAIGDPENPNYQHAYFRDLEMQDERKRQQQNTFVRSKTLGYRRRYL